MSAWPQTLQEWLLFAGILGMVLMTNACHEAAHAFTAFVLGDQRREIFERATLNPLKHVHWFLTLVLPLISFLLLGWVMGGAKPVRVDAGRIGPWRMALVAFAGPVANFLFAGFVVAVLGALIGWGFIDSVDAISSPAWRILKPAVWFSVVLGLLNLVPLPPLDGSRMVGALMPEGLRRVWYALAPAGIICVLVLTLWIGGQLAPLGLGAGHPEIYARIAEIAEDQVFAMAAFWRSME